MNPKTLLLVLSAVAFLGGPVLAAGSSSPTTAAKVTKVVKVEGMDKEPVAVKKVAPDYPLALREVGVEGTATVDMLVDSTGRVVETTLISTTVRELGPLAVAAAKEWTFVPASSKGRPVMTRVRVPFEFMMPQLVAMDRH